MTRSRLRWVWTSLPIVLFASPASAADPSPQEVQLARQLFEEGITLEKKGDCNAALDRFRRVATVKSSPSLKFHTGLCEETLGHLVIALTFYQEAQADAAQKSNQEVTGAVRAPLANLETKLPKLVPVIVTDLPTLEVSVDGKPIPKGLWGMEIRVEPGRHTIDGKADGMVPTSQSVDFPEGARVEVKVKLDAKIAPPAPAAPLPSGRAPTSLAPSTQPNEAPPRDAAQNAPSRTGAMLATAGAVVLVGGGFASFFYSGSLASDAQAQCAKDISCDNLKGPVRTYDALALTGWICGAALAGIAIYTWTRSPERAAQSTAGEKSDTPRAMLVPGPGALFLRATF